MQEDFNKIYEYVGEEKAKLLENYKYLSDNKQENLQIFDTFADELKLVVNDEVYFVLICRLVSLKEEPLLAYLKENKFNEDEILQIQDKAYIFVKNFWHKHHEKLNKFISKKSLLSPFYREIVKGVYNIGLTFSNLQVVWKQELIDGVNKELMNKYGDTKSALSFLKHNKLFEVDENEQPTEKSYSILQKNEAESYVISPYITAFKKEVTDVIDEIEILLVNLIELEDDEYSEKWNWILYFQSLVIALAEHRVDSLLASWAKVDVAWMKIKTPLQVAHPLEYYEDHLRKAVAMEWDLRLSKADVDDKYDIKKNILKMYSSVYDSLGQKSDVYEFSLKALDMTQMYISRPIMFFGAELNGLFSAQVVPNDESISSKHGKKIFAYIDEIYEETLSKPKMKLDTLVFEKSFLNILEEHKNNKDRWYETYIYSTIGHEFGHILWVDDASESVMNDSGNFKNIEEFKATTGGLVSFFHSENENLKKAIVTDLVGRSVKLMGYKEVKEIEPYYVEGLIHLNLLYKSGVIRFEDKIVVDFSQESYDNLKKNYTNIYSKLAKVYLDKKDANEFLKEFVVLENGFYMPQDEDIICFVEDYYEMYKKFGREILSNS